MMVGLVRATALMGAMAFATAAYAQSSQVVRGDVARVEGNTLYIKSASGQQTPIRLARDTRVRLLSPTPIDAIKPGSFVGSAAKPGANGMLVASEVHIFPESMRGAGEGHRPMPSLPGSTMTNATVASVSGGAPKAAGTMTNATVANVGRRGPGTTLKLTYKGGEQTVLVPDKVPVVTVEPADRHALSPGVHVLVYATRDTSGTLAAQRISVGKNGSVPPI